MFISSIIIAETKQVIQEGIAYIGNGITVEDAKNVAINDARQKALNSLGAFFESHKKVTDNRLTKDEISSITGAVMKSTELKSEKEIQGEMFVLKLTVKFDIDVNSFNKALEKYLADSESKMKWYR